MGMWVAFSKVKDATTKMAKGIVKAAKKGASNICASVKALYDTISGNTAKKISEEAKRIYEESRKKYEAELSHYEERCDNLNKDICSILDDINKKKEYVIDTLFVKLQDILAKIKYEKRFIEEHMPAGISKITKIELRNDVLKIDFKKNPIKSRLKAIFTFGFWANKQANESLDEAKNEAKKLEDAMTRMKADLNRYGLMKKALEQMNAYLSEMIEIYNKILYKANNSANLLRFKCMQFTHSVNAEYCKLETLPKVDQDMMYSLFNLSVILNTVAKLHLSDNSTEKEIDNYNSKLSGYKKEFEAKAA